MTRPVPVVTDAPRATGARPPPVGSVMVARLTARIARPRPIEGQVARVREPGVGVEPGRPPVLPVPVVPEKVLTPDPVGEAVGQGPIAKEVAPPSTRHHGAPLLGVPPVRAAPLVTPRAIEQTPQPT